MKEKKNRTISLRVTENEYKYLSDNAIKNNQTVSAYIANSKIPRNLSKSYKRSLIPVKVNLQQSLNILSDYLATHTDTDPLLENEITKIKTECEKLWAN